MLLHVLDALRGAGQITRIVVITGPGHDQLRAVVPAGIDLLHNPDHDSGGMISSVQVALAELRAAGGSCAAAIIALGDQPLAQPTTVTALIDAWRGSRPRIVLPRHRQRRGHPILLDAAGFDEILSLSRHETLTTYTSRHARATMEIEVNDPAILFDVDTPDDFARAQALLTRGGVQLPGRRIASCPSELPSDFGAE